MGSRSETFAESTFRAIKCGQNAGKIQTRILRTDLDAPPGGAVRPYLGQPHTLYGWAFVSGPPWWGNIICPVQFDHDQHPHY